MNRQIIWIKLSSCKASRTLLLHCCSGQPDQQKHWSSHRLAPLLMRVQPCSKQFNQSSFIFPKRNIFFTLFLCPPPSPTIFVSLSLSLSLSLQTIHTPLSPSFPPPSFEMATGRHESTSRTLVKGLGLKLGSEVTRRQTLLEVLV